MRIILVLLLLVIPLEKISAQSFDYDEISQQLLSHVNHFRDSIGLQKLSPKTELEKAAKDQADYVNWTKELGHDQTTYNKQTPAERVFYYGGNYNYIGENVAFIIGGNGETFKSEAVMAKELFANWMNSPGHRANILNPHYYHSGIAFSYDAETKKLYAAQVFSALGYSFPKHLVTPPKAYGVQSYSESACKGAKNFRYGTLSFSNGIFTVGDSIFIRYHDLCYFQRVINNPNDGYAIDIVFRDQFPCNSPNRLHGSDIFDGYMLEPVFWYELFASNRSANPNKLIAYLGKLPRGLKPHELNLILIKDNQRCDYSYPVQTPARDIPPLYIEPVTVEIEAKVDPFEIDTIIEIPFSFERSSAKWNENHDFTYVSPIIRYHPFVKNISIETYSSVEGKEWFNLRIQEERATKIQALFKRMGFVDDKLYDISAKENWEKFNAQIKADELSEFDDMTREEVKLFLKRNNGQYDSLLFEQRRSVARIKIKGIVKDINDPYHSGLLAQKAISEGNTDLVTYILHKHFENYNYSFAEIPDTLYSQSRALGCNQLALVINRNYRTMPEPLQNKDIATLDLDNELNTYYTVNWINQYYHDLYRLSHSYYSNPDEDRPILGPDTVFQVLQRLDEAYFKDSTYLPRLNLNHCLSAIHYYTWKNQWEYVNTNFERIMTYFFKANLPVKEATDLALYANWFHRYDRAVEMLAPYFENETLDENAAFVLAQTATLIQNELENDTYTAYMKKAHEFNPERWCQWLNDNFQVMRNEAVKEMYCDYCK